MKKLLLFVTVLALFGNAVNAQELRRQLIEKSKTSQVVSPAQKIDKAAAKRSMLSEPRVNKFDALKTTMSFGQKVNKAPSRVPGDVILSEGFEGTTGDNLPGGWTRSNLSYGGESWQITSDLYEIGLPAYAGTNYAACAYPDGDDNDAWLFSSGMALEAGHSYSISFYTMIYGYYYYGFWLDYEQFELKIGQAASSAGMTDLLYYNIDEPITDWSNIIVTFTPSVSGTYYLGFHDFTYDYEGNFVAIDDVLVTEIEAIIPADCSAPISTFPWTENFNSSTFPPDCWSQINSLPNGNWKRSTSTPVYDGGCAYRADVDATGQSSYLITPAISLSGACQLDFMSYIGYPGYYVGGSNDADGRSRIYISTTVNDNISAFSEIYYLQGTEVAASWQNISVNLAAYAGQTVYLAFVYTGDYAHNWRIDDVSISELLANDAEITAITTPVSGSNLTATETVTATIKNNGSNPITTLNLKLTVDGTVVAAGETFTPTTAIAAGATANYIFNAKANLSAAGNHTIMVTAILAGDENAANDSKTITVNNTVCNAISLPWTENFENVNTLGCWGVIDANNDGMGWNYQEAYNEPEYPTYDAHSGDYFMVSQSWADDVAITPDNYLITPPLAIPTGGATLEYWIGESYNEGVNEYYSVLVSTTGTNVADFTSIHSQALTTTDWVKKSHSLTAYAGQNIYIAFRHHNCSDAEWLKLDDISVSGTTAIPVVNGNEINIYQNNDGIFVTVSEKSDVRLLDIYGRVLGNYNAAANSTLNIHQPTGMYLIEVRGNGGVSTHKVIVK